MASRDSGNFDETLIRKTVQVHGFFIQRKSREISKAAFEVLKSLKIEDEFHRFEYKISNEPVEGTLLQRACFTIIYHYKANELEELRYTNEVGLLEKHTGSGVLEIGAVRFYDPRIFVLVKKSRFGRLNIPTGNSWLVDRFWNDFVSIFNALEVHQCKIAADFRPLYLDDEKLTAVVALEMESSTKQAGKYVFDVWSKNGLILQGAEWNLEETRDPLAYRRQFSLDYEYFGIERSNIPFRSAILLGPVSDAYLEVFQKIPHYFKILKNSANEKLAVRFVRIRSGLTDEQVRRVVHLTHRFECGRAVFELE